MGSTVTDRLAGVSGNLAVKAPVLVATTANITLSGEQTIDGVAAVADDRVLVKSQTDGIENGIYDAKSGAWVRSSDFDGIRDVKSGTMVMIASGSAGTGLVYRLSTADDITIGTTSVAFTLVSLATASAFMLTVLDDANAAAVRATIGAVSEMADDLSPSLGGILNTNSKQVRESKGADVASAAALPVLADGNYFDVTGTDTITSIDLTGVRSGTEIKLHFDDALTLTHHATNLVLPGGANIPVKAGDEAKFTQYGTDVWRCTDYQRATGTALVVGKLVQVVNVQDAAVATGTTVIPGDDTIPQNTEGDEYITLAITPTNSSNTLMIDVVVNLASSAATNDLIAALFQDSTAGALAAAQTRMETSNQGMQIVFTHKMTAGTTSATTFKVRAGAASAGTTTFNGAAGSRVFGGVMASNITISEIAP